MVWKRSLRRNRPFKNGFFFVSNVLKRIAGKKMQFNTPTHVAALQHMLRINKQLVRNLANPRKTVFEWTSRCGNWNAFFEGEIDEKLKKISMPELHSRPAFDALLTSFKKKKTKENPKKNENLFEFFSSVYLLHPAPLHCGEMNFSWEIFYLKFPSNCFSSSSFCLFTSTRFFSEASFKVLITKLPPHKTKFKIKLRAGFDVNWCVNYQSPGSWFNFEQEKLAWTSFDACEAWKLSDSVGIWA